MSPLIIPIFGMLIPITALIGALIVKPWLRLKERQLEAQTSLTAEKAAQYAAQTERLEQRVRVLERIVTDRGHDLAGEIESLRGDQPTIGTQPLN